MSRNREIIKYQHTIKLEKLSNPYYLHKGLEKKYLTQNTSLKKRLQDEINEYNDKINHYNNWLQSNKKIKEGRSSQDIAIPVDENSDLETIAKKAASFFQQGLEMYLTSQKMHINSSPLVEYYSFLQCVKGRVLLDLEIKDNSLFSFHGLIVDREATNTYMKVKVKPFGVFQALLLLKGSITEINDYLSGKYVLKLESLIEKKLLQKTFDPTNFIEKRVDRDDPMPRFVMSFILSSLVRYFPQVWQEIYLGLSDSIILKIHDYRRDEITDALDAILPFY